MIRAGVHPHKVSAILSQPIMRELVDRVSYKEGLIENQASWEIENELADEIGLERDKRTGMYSSDINGKFEDLSFEELLGTAGSTDYSSEAVNSRIILGHYLDSKNTVKKYSNLVGATKTDAGGAGSSIADLMLKVNKLGDGLSIDEFVSREGVHTPYGIVNAYARFFDENGKTTLSYRQYVNVAETVMDLIENNPNVFGRISMQDMQDLNTLYEGTKGGNGRILGKGAMQFLLKQADLFRLQQFEPLTRKTSNAERQMLDNKIIELRSEGNYKIINSILKSDDGYIMDNVSRSDPRAKNAFTDSWRKLLVDHPEVGDYLVRESFDRGSFNPGPQNFHQLIPFEWFQNKGLHSYVSNMHEEYELTSKEFYKFLGDAKGSNIVFKKEFNKMDHEGKLIVTSDMSHNKGTGRGRSNTMPLTHVLDKEGVLMSLKSVITYTVEDKEATRKEKEIAEAVGRPMKIQYKEMQSLLYVKMPEYLKNINKGPSAEVSQELKNHMAEVNTKIKSYIINNYNRVKNIKGNSNVRVESLEGFLPKGKPMLRLSEYRDLKVKHTFKKATDTNINENNC